MNYVHAAAEKNTRNAVDIINNSFFVQNYYLQPTETEKQETIRFIFLAIDVAMGLFVMFIIGIIFSLVL